MKLLDKLDKRYLKICTYAGVTVLVVAAIAMILWYSGGFFASLWNLIGSVLVPLVFGAILSYLLHPVVERVNFALSKGKPDSEQGRKLWAPSVFITLAMVALVLIAIVVLLVIVITKSISSLSFATIVETVTELWNKLQTDFASIFYLIKNAVGQASEAAPSFDIGDTATKVIAGVSGFVLSAAFSVVFALWFMLDGPRLAAYGKRVVGNLVPAQLVGKVREILADADSVFSAYIRGQFVDALIFAAANAVLLSVCQVPYGAIIGIISGIGNLIPGFGAPVGFVMVAVVCLTQGNYVALAVGAAVIFVVSTVDANIVNPRLMSKSISVHPLVSLASLIAGGAVGGVVGMLVAVPTGAFLKLRFDRWMDAREKERANAE